MKVVTLLFLFSAVVQPTTGKADEPMIMIWSNQDQTPVSTEIERIYLQGAVTALGTANAFSISSGSPRLFCVPLNHNLTVEEFREMAESNLVGLVPPDLVIMAAIDALIEKYPCL